MRTLRLLPTLMRVSFAEAVAYRAEMFVWVLATTMPFVMMMLWSSVATAGPVQGNARSYDSNAFHAYFLAVFIVRQLVSTWAAWEINFEVKQGTLSMRLLRPMHPILAYAAGHIAALPMRILVTLPVVFVIYGVGAASGFSQDKRLWGLALISLALGWCVSFFANVAMGALSFWLESSVKVMEVWMAGFFVFSGYLFPLDLFPSWLRLAADVLPFRFQLGVPVELLMGAHDFDESVRLVTQQCGWVAGLGLLAWVLWTVGVRRFQSVGG